MKKGDILELRTIDRRGFIGFQHVKVKDVQLAKKILAENDFSLMSEPNTYFRSYQYQRGEKAQGR